MRRMSMLVVGLIVLVFAVAAAGCGGGGDKSAATTTEAVTTEAATTEEATTEEATTEEATTEEATTEEATTEEATTEEATTEAATTTNAISGFAAGKCRDLAEASQKLSTSFSGNPSGADIKKQAELFQEFVKDVPSEIRADFQVLADYVSKLAEVLGSVKAGASPDPQTLAKLQKLATEVDQTKITQASQNVSAWVQKNCKA